jgi:hypothetical protein
MSAMSNLPQLLRANEVAIHEAGIVRRHTPARVERAVGRAVVIEHAHGIFLAARIQTTDYVAALALHDIADLSEHEAHYVERVPHAKRRLGRIVDIASEVMGEIVYEAGGE